MTTLAPVAHGRAKVMWLHLEASINSGLIPPGEVTLKGAVAQSVERETPSEVFLDSILAMAARSLLVESVSV